MFNISLGKHYCRMPPCNSKRRNVLSYDTTCLYDCAFTNCNTRKYNHIDSEPDIIADNNILDNISVIVWDSIAVVIVIFRN